MSITQVLDFFESTRYRVASSTRSLVSQRVLLLVLFTVAVRSPSLVHPQPIDDEAVYAVVASEILAGGLPYLSAVERKPPLLFWTYAAVFELAGKSWYALHFAALLWVLSTMGGMYLLSRRLFGAEAGLFAALFCALYSSWGPWKNLAWNGEVLMNLPIVWAAALVLRRGSSFRGELFVAGVLFALGFLLKQPAAIAALPFGLYVLLPSYRASRGITLSMSLAHAALLVSGFAAALGTVAAMLWSQGILADAYYWTFTNHDLPHVFVSRGIAHTSAFVLACLPLVLGTAYGLRLRALWAGKDAERTALVGFLLASLIGTCASARFYPHYYVQLVPPLGLLAAPAYARCFGTARPRAPLWQRPRVVRGWLVLTALVFFVMHVRGLSPRRKEGDAARYVRTHASPDDRLFVWGHAPQIYLQTGLRPASRYILTFPLTGYIFGAPLPGVDTRDRILPGAWDRLGADLRARPPAFIVDTQLGPSARYPIVDFPLMKQLLERHYRLVWRHRDAVYQRITIGEMIVP